MTDGAATHLSEIPRVAAACGHYASLACETMLKEQLKSPGDHRRAKVKYTHTTITSEAAECVCVFVSECGAHILPSHCCFFQARNGSWK